MSINDKINKKEKDAYKLYEKNQDNVVKDLKAIYNNSANISSEYVYALYSLLPELTEENLAKGLLLPEAQKYDRLNKTYNKIGEEIKKLNIETISTIKTATLDAALFASLSEVFAVDSSIKLNVPYKYNPDKIKSFLFSDKYENTWTARNAANNQSLFNKIKNELTQALNKGQSAQKTASAIKKSFLDFDVVNKKTVVKGAYKDAIRIARTETHRAYMQGKSEGFNQVQGFAKKKGMNFVKVFVAVLDSRTRNQSASMDGREANEDGLFKYPNGVLSGEPGNTGIPAYDINDRDAYISKLEGYEGAGSEKDISFKDWAKSQGITKSKFGEKYVFN